MEQDKKQNRKEVPDRYQPFAEALEAQLQPRPIDWDVLEKKARRGKRRYIFETVVTAALFVELVAQTAKAVHADLPSPLDACCWVNNVVLVLWCVLCVQWILCLRKAKVLTVPTPQYLETTRRVARVNRVSFIVQLVLLLIDVMTFVPVLFWEENGLMLFDPTIWNENKAFVLVTAAIAWLAGALCGYLFFHFDHILFKLTDN